MASIAVIDRRERGGDGRREGETDGERERLRERGKERLRGRLRERERQRERGRAQPVYPYNAALEWLLIKFFFLRMTIILFIL